MARRTEEQEQAAKVAPPFPYAPLTSHPAWDALDKAIADLEANDDLTLQTAREYAVGYIVQALVKSGLVPPVFPDHLSAEERKRYSWILAYSAPSPSKKRTQQTVRRIAATNR
jgi:cystathionine beta-lyase/cystathionine gamma-synthase